MTYSPADPSDVGLLSPVSAGMVAETRTGDGAVLAAMVTAEVALVRALVQTGIAPAGTERVITRIEAADLDPRDLAVAATVAGNPVVPLVKRLRDQVDPKDAAWVHFGTTSQDIVDTALMVVASEVTRRLEADLTRLASTLADLADRTRTLSAVARTLTQQALPTTLGFRVAGWLAGVHDAVRMVRTCTTLPVSLGGPVGTASAYGADGPAVLEAFAAHLGQRAAVGSWHTRRTPIVGLATALTISGASCAKIAADVLVMSQTEIGEAREGTGGPSSAMAHKANPAQSLLVASAAQQLPALGSIIGASAAPEQERPAGAWQAEWQTLRMMLRLASGAAERTANLVEEIVFDHDALARNLATLVGAVGKDDSWVTSHTEHIGIWIDRVLQQHSEVFA